jgi:hypothetical protein
VDEKGEIGGHHLKPARLGHEDVNEKDWGQEKFGPFNIRYR